MVDTGEMTPPLNRHTLSDRMRAAIVVGMLLLALAAPAAAHNNGAYHTKRQAETNVLKVVMVAMIRNPKLGATLDTRARCVGIGSHVGLRYNHFVCTIGPWKGVATVKYHALRNGHYTVSLS
jgi:hypothetical protein